MKVLISFLIINLADYGYGLCSSQPGVTTCRGELLRRNSPLQIQNYQNLLEFPQGQLSTIPSGTFKLLPELKILLISNNKLVNLEAGCFNGLYNLEKLSLYNNLLQTIDSVTFKELRNIKIINLGSNKLTDIHKEAFVGLNNLEEINLSFNLLTALPEAVNTIKSLKILNLNNNNLKKIPSNAFKNLNNLLVLNLADNAITEVANKAFKGLYNLKELNLKSNYLSRLNTQDLLEDLRALSTVKLSINSFGCRVLGDIDRELKSKGVSLEKGINLPGNNVYNGIKCIN